MTTQDLNAAVARLLYPDYDNDLNEHYKRYGDTRALPDYTEDVGAAFEACWKLGYQFQISTTDSKPYVQLFKYSVIRFVASAYASDHSTQAIATALVAAEVKADE